jgi:uncharacterized protein
MMAVDTSLNERGVNHARRGLLAGVGAASVAPQAAFVALQALAQRQAQATALRAAPIAPIPSPYGALTPVVDLNTGIPLLQLPPGFSYRSFAWTGDIMDDGQPCPDRHDGMGVIAAQAVGSALEVVLVRNHERAITPDTIAAPRIYNAGRIRVLGAEALRGRAGGGTTNLVVRDGQLRSMRASLGGTLVNCAGGVTPWGTWLTCEEFLQVGEPLLFQSDRDHGYVYEVRADPLQTTGQPIRGMGRFAHEAAAVDPATGIVYLSEDSRNKSALYRYVPLDRSSAPGSLERGGELQAARVVGVPRADLLTPQIGDTYRLEWVPIARPERGARFAPSSLGDVEAVDIVSGPFSQAWSAGCLRMSRGEGLHCVGGQLYIVDTSAGVDEQGRRGRGEGAVWMLDMASMTLRAVFVSGNALAANNPDNITLSPRGGVLVCEDGGASVDEAGVGSRLVVLTPQGECFHFCKNNVALEADPLAAAGKNVLPGDYRSFEFCGACWDPTGRHLFVNIQTPGITFAITGPWQSGPL